MPLNRKRGLTMIDMLWYAAPRVEGPGGGCGGEGLEGGMKEGRGWKGWEGEGRMVGGL